MPSKIAVALAEAISPWVPDWVEGKGVMARVIDERLAEIRRHYEPEELARCPIVSHHPDPCVGCITAAMREFILVPESCVIKLTKTQEAVMATAKWSCQEESNAL